MATNRTIDLLVEDHVIASLELQNRSMLTESIYSFAKVFVPEREKRGYSPRKFQEYWLNTFLEHERWGMRHPIIEVATNKPVHPIYAQDAAWIESAQVVEGVNPEYRFVKLPDDTWLLREYALSATFHDVMALRRDVQQ